MQRNVVITTPNRADALICGALRSVTDLQTYCMGLGSTDQLQPLDVKQLVRHIPIVQ
jgi:hypothetical protein